MYLHTFASSLMALKVTTRAPGSQAMGTRDPSQTAVMAVSRERPCFLIVERERQMTYKTVAPSVLRKVPDIVC
jgi:hypothetical protein